MTTRLQFFRDLQNQFKLSSLINSDELVIIEKENWSYPSSLEAQKILVNYVKENPRQRVFIITSHPECLTNGRGLQKGKDIDSSQLIEFEQSEQLPFPLYQISRGGGLTFHHPGQYIVYPIIKLGPDKFTIKNIIYELLDLTKKTLEKCFDLKELSYENAMLGLWKKEQKLASVGVATERYTTYHGMALNLEKSDMLERLNSLYPCGMNIKTYSSVAENLNEQQSIRAVFHREFLSQLQKGFFANHER